jgi:hypothetical protein
MKRRRRALAEQAWGMVAWAIASEVAFVENLPGDPITCGMAFALPTDHSVPSFFLAMHLGRLFRQA